MHPYGENNNVQPVREPLCGNMLRIESGIVTWADMDYSCTIGKTDEQCKRLIKYLDGLKGLTRDDIEEMRALDAPRQKQGNEFISSWEQRLSFYEDWLEWKKALKK